MKKILKRLGKTFYHFEGDVHTQYGVIKEADLVGNKATSHTGKEFIMYDAKFVDSLKKIKRAAATMHLKDIGMIMAYAGIGKETVCVEAGAGSGMLTSCLAHVCKQVYSFEKVESNFQLVKKNLEKLGLTNVDIVNEDVSSLDKKDVDVIVLDLPNPWNYLDVCYSSLKSGGFLVCYLPTVTQMSDLAQSFKDEFIVERIIEVLEREWVAEGKKVRPLNQMLGHTAFLVFLRKI